MPDGRGVDLEVGLAEAVDALVVTGRIKHAEVEIDRLADPLTEGRVVGEVVVGQRMDERTKA